MITYKKIEMEDVERFWNLLNALDIETNYMMISCSKAFV